MYYQTYRPQKIADIDHKDRRDLLAKLFARPASVPHALLLVGPRGTGKTSTARIIAKVVNCERNIFGGGKDIDACNECESCIAIQNGRALDVHEMDAASNRGVDDIRSLREEVNFAPSFSRYKVYIIDEVHMLTKEAFNALLKTLEEPPEKTLFIMATTERERIPETILSRAMAIGFTQATEEELIHALGRIVTGEKLHIDTVLLTRIAQEARGSFRDGAKLLELAVTTTDQSPEAVEHMLGQLHPPVEELFNLIADKKQHEAIIWVDHFTAQGGNPLWLSQSLARYVREKLIDAKTSKERNALAKISRSITSAYDLQRFSPVPDLPLMAAIVELTE